MNQLIKIGDIYIRQDQNNRYCLNDLHQASGKQEKHAPNRWARTNSYKCLVEELTPNMAFAPVDIIHGGINPGTYACKELVYAYAMWISASFHIKVIRTFDFLVNKSEVIQPPTTDKIQAGILLIESAAKTLGLSNSSKLGAYQTLQSFVGLPNLMPSYAIDAPSDAVDGSSRTTASLSRLLKDNHVGLSVHTAFSILNDIGIVARLSRPSKSGDKYFWSITNIGLLYGKNITSPHNPRETQPHFFHSRFSELLKLMNNSTYAA